MINVSILGYGTVGGGVARVLQQNAKQIAERTGDTIRVKSILDLRDFPGDPNEKIIVHDFNDILNDPEVSVVCETMGGTKPAFEFSKALLSAGKCVCTSNKELVEAHGAELMEIARQHNCRYMFEASVGGGIPIIRTIADALTSENISEITGILNGTTNYILTRMDREGAPFDEILKDAQANGYAEKNPTADIEGHDACRKIAILTSLVTGKKLDYSDIPTEGISKVTNLDFAFAKVLGKSIKLLAMSRIDNGHVRAMVAPFLVGAEHPLYAVSDVFNAILLHSDMLDDSMYYGRGAGMLATASAVCGDVIECATRPHDKGRSFWSREKLNLVDPDSVTNKFFLRINSEILPRVELENALGELTFVEILDEKGCYGVVTQSMEEGEVKKAIAALADKSPSGESGVESMIRVL